MHLREDIVRGLFFCPLCHKESWVLIWNPSVFAIVDLFLEHAILLLNLDFLG